MFPNNVNNTTRLALSLSFLNWVKGLPVFPFSFGGFLCCAIITAQICLGVDHKHSAIEFRI